VESSVWRAREGPQRQRARSGRGLAWRTAAEGSHGEAPRSEPLGAGAQVALLSIMAAWVWLRMARLLSVARTLHRQRSTAVGRLDVSFDDGLGRHSSCSSSNGSSDEEPPPRRHAPTASTRPSLRRRCEQEAVLGVITEGAEQQQQQHALLRPRSLPAGLGRLSS